MNVEVASLLAVDAPDLHVCQHDIPYRLGGASAFIRFYLGSVVAAEAVGLAATRGSSIVT
jgi:hypothetical protein